MSNYAIYQPKGKAAEYAQWACNFYVGCSNGCTYCYLKKGIGAKTLGGQVPTLKKCFRDEKHALGVFEKELKVNLPELQKHGLFFSFTTDPLIRQTCDLTMKAAHICFRYNIPVKILTKSTFDFNYLFEDAITSKATLNWLSKNKHLIAFGLTLTGHDELEPRASTNQERIEAIKKLHEAGFKTFASIEPIIDFESSFHMICQTSGFCDLYKIGLESGKKYDKKELQRFINGVNKQALFYEAKVYWKDSITKIIGKVEPNSSVGRDYNIFEL
jgi:DNA repair photolyase